MIVKFGIWEIDEEYGLIGRPEHGGEYPIAKNRLWEVRNYRENVQVWDWLLHLIEKSWVKKEEVNDLNTAFCFAQDYFKEFRPEGSAYVSLAQTLYIQNQELEIRELLDTDDVSDEIEITSFDKLVDDELMKKASEMYKNMKFLKIK